MDIIMHFIRCFYVPSWSLPQGWQLFRHAEGNPICKDQPFTEKSVDEVQKQKNTERQDIMTPAAWVGRRRKGQTLSKYSSSQGTEWK